MQDLAAIVVAFLLVSAGVAALARNTTARWERERRAARRARRAAAGPPAPRSGPTARLSRAVTAAATTAATAAGSAAAVVRVRLRAAVRSTVRHTLRHVGAGASPPAARDVVPQPRPAGDPPVDGGAGGGTAPPAAASHRRLHLPRRRTAGTTRGSRGSALPRLTSRLTARVGHLPVPRGTPRAPDDPGGA